jgi:ribonuclease P protein component
VSRATGPKEPSFSLPYPFRLHQRQEFFKFFEGSTVARLRNVIVFRVPNDLGHFRLGITFKIKCSSVERNALRRRIRETFRKLRPSLGSYDYNIVVRSFQSPMKIFARQLAGEIQSGLGAANFQPAKPKRSAL